MYLGEKCIVKFLYSLGIIYYNKIRCGLLNEEEIKVDS